MLTQLSPKVLKGLDITDLEVAEKDDGEDDGGDADSSSSSSSSQSASSSSVFHGKLGSENFFTQLLMSVPAMSKTFSDAETA